MRRVVRLLLAAAVVSVAGVLVATAGAAKHVTRARQAAGKAAVITSSGTDTFRPDPANPPSKEDVLRLEWHPGTITVRSGQRLTLVDKDNFGEPHVFVISPKKDLPTNDHGNPFANPVVRVVGPEVLKDPSNPNAGFKTTVANRGRPGLNTIGDALVLLQKGSKVSAVVSAKPGTTLYYFCAIHFWMQGKIVVK